MSTKLSSPWGKEFEHLFKTRERRELKLIDLPSHGITREMEQLIKKSERLKSDFAYHPQKRPAIITRRTNIEKQIIRMDLELRNRGILTEIERAGRYSKVIAKEAPKRKKSTRKKKKQASIFNGFV